LSSANITKIALIVAIAAALTISLNMCRHGFIGTLDWAAKQQDQDTVDTVSSKNNSVKLIAADVENRINDSIGVMQLTSKRGHLHRGAI